MNADRIEMQCQVEGAHTFETLTLNRTTGDDHVYVRIDRGSAGQISNIRVRSVSLLLAVQAITTEPSTLNSQPE